MCSCSRPARPALVSQTVGHVGSPAGGRLSVAVGVGWNAAEYEGLGVGFAERTRRLEEQMVVMRALWTEPLVTFDGE